MSIYIFFPPNLNFYTEKYLVTGKMKKEKNQTAKPCSSLKKKKWKSNPQDNPPPLPQRVCVNDGVCWGARGGVVAHSVAVAHKPCGRAAHDILISFTFSPKRHRISGEPETEA